MHLSTPQFLSTALGRPQASAPLTRQPTPGVTARVNRNGYTVRRDGSALTLSLVGASAGAWQRTANGATRATPFGSEAVAIDASSIEQYLVVDRHLGLHTWRWRIQTSAVPHLGTDGSVTFTKDGKALGYSIAPVSLTDGARNSITPAGLRWSLSHAGGKTYLVLRFDDSKLPTPYVIDPATDYASPLYDTSSTSAVLGGGSASSAPGLTYTLVTTSPGANVCNNISGGGADTCPAIIDNANNSGTSWAPIANTHNVAPPNTTFTASPATPATGQTANGGYLVDAAGASGGSTTIPSGTWTFNTWAGSDSAAKAGVNIYLSVGVYLVTTSGTGASATIASVDQTVIDPTSNAGTTNIADMGVTLQTVAVAGVPQVTLSSSQHLYVVYWAQKVVTGAANKFGHEVAIAVNGTGSIPCGMGCTANITSESQISLPAAYDTLTNCTSCTWTGGGGNNNWSNGANWSGGLPPATDGSATLTFPSTAYLSPNNDEPAGTTFAGINISGNGYTLAGNSIALGSGGITDSNSSGSNTVSLNMSLANAATPIVVTNAAETLTLSGVISGAGGPAKSGSGVLIPSNTNTYTGGTTISGGTLQANASAAIGDGSGTNTLSLSGGTLQATGTITSPSTRTVTLSGASTIDTNGNAVSIAGVISGTAGSLAKNGSGALTLSATNTFTGGFTLNAGEVDINSAQALGTNAGTFTIAGGTIDNTSGGSINTVNYPQSWSGDFTFTGSNALNLGTGAVAMTASRQVTVSASTLTVGGAISGSGFGLTKLGAGTLAINGNNTFSGALTISAGTLSGDNTQSLGNSSATNTLVFDGGTLQATAGITSNATRPVSMTGTGTIDTNGNAVSIAGAISGSGGALTKIGSGTLTLSGTNTFSGGLNLNAGQLTVGSTTALGTGTLTIAGGTTLDANNNFVNANNNAQAWNGDFTFAGSKNLDLGTGAVTMNASRQVTVNGSTLTVGGVISGPGFSLTKAGSGALALGGANTFTGGTTLSAGQLNINNAQALGTVAGTFTITGGTIDNTSGGSITTLNYSQAWNGDFTFKGTNDLNLGTGAVTLSANRQVTANGSTLTVGGVISGAGFSLTKSGGGGALALAGANTFDGGTTLSGGTLDINNAQALGTAAGTFTVSGNATIDNTSGGPITTLNYPQTWNGNITFTGTNDLNLGTGAVAMQKNLTVATNGSTLTVGGAISGTGDKLTVAGTAGALTLSGANTFTGGTQLNQGTLNINNATALGTGTFTFQNNATIDNTSGSPITETNNNPVTLQNGGTINFAGTNDLNLGTGAVTGGNNTKTIQVSGSNLTIGGVITITGASSGLTKTGSGTLTLNGNNVYTGTTTVSAGVLVFNGSQSTTAVSLNGGTLAGSGTTGAVTSTASGGTVAPGTPSPASPGILNTGAVDLSTGSPTFSVQLNGTTAGTGYSQLSVTGGVNLTGASLTGSVGYTPANGDTYTIINNITAGAVTGTFAGQPEGSTVTLGGKNFVISYTGGDGNDVVLTYANCTSCTWTGGGGDNNWSTGANWSGGFAPATDGSSTLNFPGSTLQQSNNNDFTAGTVFAGINISGSGYTLAGNQVTLGSGGISDTTTSGSSTISLPLTSTAVRTVSVTNAAETLTLSGVYSGTGGGVTKSGSGVLTLSGANTFDSGVTLGAGTLNINNATALGTGTFTISGGTIDNTSGGSITESNNNAQAWNGDFTFWGSNDLNLGTGAVTLGATRQVAVISVSATLTVGGVISGSGFGLTFAGYGTLTLSGNNTYSGTTTVSAGTLTVNGSQPFSAVSLNGGTLNGTGTTGAITSTGSGGTLAPGTPLGVLATSNVDLSSGSPTFSVELNGTTVGSGYSQLHAMGTVDITGASLSASLGYTPTNGDSYTIINNDSSDAVTGTFSGLPEGTGLVIGGKSFRISYVGGTGNDVVLTAGGATKLAITSVPANATANTNFSVTVQSQDANGNCVQVNSDTAISLASDGAGTLSGNTGTITAGTCTVTLSSVQTSQVGETIHLTASRTSGDSLTTSAASSAIVVANGDFTMITPVSINGTPTVDTTVTITHGVYSVTPATRSYQWQLCDSGGGACNNIGGATAKTYTPVASDVGSTLKVIETVSRPGYNDGGSTSSASPVVIKADFSTSTAVAINGTPTVGTATTLTAGSYTPTPTSSSYQWRRCDVAGNNCADIGGATNSTYTPVAGDVNHTLKVVETVSKAGYNDGSSTSERADVVKGTMTTNTAVAINGTPKVGIASTLTAGSYTPTPTSSSYQWQLCDSVGAGCSNISGATSSTYTPVGGDAGSTLRVVETVSTAGYKNHSSTSDASPVVLNGDFATNTAVSIKGTPKVGVASTVKAGSYTPTPTGRSYQWELCDNLGSGCSNIGGATNSTYTPVAGDVGSTLRVMETVSSLGYNDASSTSSASAVVINGDFTTTSAVMIDGQPTVGTATTITNGVYSPTATSSSYQWELCDSSGNNCSNIGGATSDTYTPVTGDVGSTLRVVETVSRAGYNDSGSTSSAVVVKGIFTTNVAVAINGLPKVGTASTITAGTYTPSPSGRSYQWQRCDSSGNNCGAISGATYKTYTPVAADVGKTLRVVETVKRSLYLRSSSTSAASAPVAKGTFVVNTTVAIFGYPKVGVLSRVTKGTYTPNPTLKRHYQWLRCTGLRLASCARISGATSSAYRPVLADRGKRLRVIETVRRPGYNNLSVTSLASAKVQ